MAALSFSANFPTIEALKAANVTICGLPIDACLALLANDPWHDGKPEFTGRAVELTFDFPDIKVIKHNVTQDTYLPSGTYPVIGSSQRLLDDDTVVTDDVIAALCFSVVCNKGPMVALQAYHAKHNRLPSAVWHRSFLSHFFWAMQQWDFNAILNDPICSAVSKVTGLPLSPDLFSSELPETHVYMTGYRQLFLNPTLEQKVFFDLDRARFESNTTALGLY